MRETLTPDGLTMCASSFGPKETLDRFAAAVTNRGMAILVRIDHAASAAQAAIESKKEEIKAKVQDQVKDKLKGLFGR